MAPRGHQEEGRPTAALPQRKEGSIKLPLIAPFESPESIVQGLSTRETPLLTAALLQVEKRANALCAKAAPRAEQDPLLEYLAKFPTTDGLFSAWDTAHKTNNSQLSAAVLSALTAVIRLVSTDPFSDEPEIIRRLLTQYGSHLDRALNPGRNDVTVAALKLCNVVVGFGSGRFARRLFGSMQWSPKIITRLFRTRLKDNSRDPLTKPDIRTLLSMLVLAFLAAGDAKLKTQVIETKGLISGVVKGLSEDPIVIINHVLVSLHRDVVADRSVGLEARRSIFDESCIVELVKLYDVEDGDNLEQAPRVSVHRFLYAITEWLAKQINDSQARSFGPQKVLGAVLRTLKVTEESQQRELGLYILGRAPILAGSFWARFPSSLDPRLSSRWISAITFATQVVALPVSQHLSPSSTPPTLTALLDNVLPPTLNKTWYSKALQHDNALVSFLSSIFILAAMQKAVKILETIADTSSKLEEVAGVGRWASLAARMREHLRTVLPDPQIVVALMQKTAVGAPAPATSSKGKSKKGKAVDPAPVEAKEDESSRHLRTNVALRLLWLYHRVVPSLIATLRFDFAKLPQAHVARSDAEGIRAISSAYALRLAAIHSASLSWSRPGDHFKNTLHPLFQLYRTPSTPSNRHLLLTILGRLLTTPILFGESSSEVEVWLAALPTPSQDPSATDGASQVLDFFERCVQKTLTAPIKAPTVLEGVAAAEPASPFSPLLATVIGGLAVQMETGGAETSVILLAFVRKAFFGFLGHSQSMQLPEALAASLKTELSSLKPAKGTLKLLKDCLKVVEKQAEAQGADNFEQRISGNDRLNVLSSLSPLKENVFASLSEDQELLNKTLAEMPLELVFLHARSSDLINPATLSALLELVTSTLGHLTALQVILHRFINAGGEDQVAFAAFAHAIYISTSDERMQRKLKSAAFGEQGLLRTFAESAEATPFAAITSLLAVMLSPSSKRDMALAQPYCALVAADLASLKPKSSKKAKSKDVAVVVPPRAAAGSSLLPFFDNASSLAFLEILLRTTSLAGVSELQPSTQALLTAALARASAIASSAELRTIWSTHFIILHRLSTKAKISAAGHVLVRGAQALLPFVISSAPGQSTTLPFDGFRHGSSDLSWREHATEWTTELLAETRLGQDQSQVLATLIYRSPTTRSAFLNWINQRVLESEEAIDGSEAALRALLEVAEVQKATIEVPESIALHFTRRLLAESGVATASTIDSLRVVQLLCSQSASTATAVNALLEAHLPSIDRDAFTPSILHLVSDLATTSPSFNKTLNAYVDASFAGLVRRFAEDEEDTEAVVLLVKELHSVASKHTTLEYKSHLLEPLITAAVTRRLDRAEPIALAAALCRGHEWKSNEVTRHLNEVFASSHFRPRNLADAAPRKVQGAIIRLVIALSTSSLVAAASSRVIEKLMPFYGGTLSADDAALVDLFQRIEIVGGTSVSVAFRSWNPSLDLSPLEASRAMSLGAVQSAYVRRSWLRICASSRTTFPKEHAEITYDPHFLLPFVAHTIAEDDLQAADWITILESGVLAVVVAALGASSNNVRLVARAALKTALVKLTELSFREKDEMVLVFTHARNCIYSSEGEAIPSVIALFLANCMHIIGTPESPLYPAFTRFLLQRPLLDQRDVPMFYLLFYTTSDEPVEDHRWLLRFLAEGLVRSQDWKIYRRRQTFELLASLLQSSRQDPVSRKLVLQFLLRATSIPQAARELMSRNGLLGWISAQTPVDAAERRLLISIIGKLVDVLSNDKFPVVADTLDALALSAASTDVGSFEMLGICQIVRKLAARLPSASSPSHSLILDRARSLLSFVAARLPPSDLHLQEELYTSVMQVSFARHSAGLKEDRSDSVLFNAGVAAGLAAGVASLREETLRSLAGN